MIEFSSLHQISVGCATYIYNTCLNYKLQDDKVTDRRSLCLTVVLITSLIVICTTLLSFGIQRLLFITTSLDSYFGVVFDLILNTPPQAQLYRDNIELGMGQCKLRERRGAW